MVSLTVILISKELSRRQLEISEGERHIWGDKKADVSRTNISCFINVVSLIVFRYIFPNSLVFVCKNHTVSLGNSM